VKHNNATKRRARPGLPIALLEVGFCSSMDQSIRNKKKLAMVIDRSLSSTDRE
jgi:hypothetical protein